MPGEVQAVSEAVVELAKLKAVIAQKKQQRDNLIAQTGCKKPVIMAGKKKRDYLDCLQKHKAEIEQSKDLDRALIRMQIRQKELEVITNASTSKMKWIIGGAIGVALLITGIIVVVRMNRVK